MEVTLPWGGETLSVQVPDTWELIYPERGDKSKKPEMKNELAHVRDAINKPIGMRALEKMKLKGKRVIIIVDDNTRPTPVDRFFHLVLNALKKAGATLKNIVVIPALGIHTPMKEGEMAKKIGRKNLNRVAWENHDAFNIDRNYFFGSTLRGTPVYLNRRLKDADLVVLIGLVEPHLWAGFGGGLKNILPGVAYAETIGTHHEIIAEPPYKFNRVGVLPEKNSFRLDLEEVKEMIQADIFNINVNINHKGEINACFAGDPIESHRAGVKFNYQQIGLVMDRKVDGIIVNSFPMDINLKQSMKGVGNSLPALRKKGAVMGFLRADRGLDDIVPPEDSKPLWLVKRILRLIGAGGVRGFLERVKKSLNVEEKFLIYYSMQLIRTYDLFLHIPTLSEDEATQLGFFVNCPDPQEVIDNAVKKIGKKATVAVFPKAGGTFPIVTG